MSCLGFFPEGRRDFSRVIKKDCVPRPDFQRLLNLFMGFGILTIRVERPGEGIQGPGVVAVLDFQAGDAKCFLRLTAAVSVVSDQLYIRIFRERNLRASLPLKFRVRSGRFGRLSGSLVTPRGKQFTKRSWKFLIAFLKQFNSLGVNMLVQTDLSQFLDRKEVVRKCLKRFLQERFGRIESP